MDANEKIAAQILGIAEMLDNTPVSGRTARIRITAAVDALTNLAHSMNDSAADKRQEECHGDDCTEP